MVIDYDGHKLTTVHKWVVSHEFSHGANDNAIYLAIDDPEGGSKMVKLSIDDAQKIATTLLRDVSLARYGSG